MTDLISRQATIKALCENGMCGDKNCNAFPCEDVKAIMRVPTIDPVKHGKWIDGKYMGADGCFVWHRECSLCGYEREDDNSDKDTLFCPNCGAKMDGGEG